MVCVKTCIPSENFEFSHFEILKRNGKTVQQMASVSFTIFSKLLPDA